MIIDKCRLCSGNTNLKFAKIILHKYKVNYFECENCSSLQTENPYWLDEAYEDWLTKYDTGVYSRAEKNSLVSLFICKIFNYENVLDIGGGDGLFCRILRDYLINCYSSDKYSKNLYSKIFTKPDFKNPDLLTCFESVEHFANPKEEFDNFFKFKPKMILLTTKIYEKNDENWDYFEFQTGQHIFFFSKESLKIISKNNSYKVFFLENGFILMISNDFKCSKVKFFILKNILFRSKILQFLRVIKVFFKANGFKKDYTYIKNKK